MKVKPSVAYMDELPPARSRYTVEQKDRVRAALARAQDRRSTLRWDSRGNPTPLRKTALVCILDARDVYRDQQRISGKSPVVEADQWFWDRFFASLLAGEFDGRDRVHVVDDQPVFRMRITSAVARALTSDLYSYDEIVRRRLARCWMARRTGIGWCERHGLPVPDRWQRVDDVSTSHTAPKTGQTKRVAVAPPATTRRPGRPRAYDDLLIELDLLLNQSPGLPVRKAATIIVDQAKQRSPDLYRSLSAEGLQGAYSRREKPIPTDPEEITSINS